MGRRRGAGGGWRVPARSGGFFVFLDLLSCYTQLSCTEKPTDINSWHGYQIIFPKKEAICDH